MNGVINVYKEKGYTSHDVVAKLRGILHQKKIGHTGTLDPDATGVLPVCIGNATKLCDFLTDKVKEYEAVMLLGLTSDTYDSTGVMLTKADPDFMSSLSETQVKSAILSFMPGYEQIPPMYSAKKVNGKKLYELARAGKEVEREAVYVELRNIEIVDITLPRVTFRVTCSKGTYIRSLCHDIGAKLGCGAVMENLIRTRVSQFEIKDALKLSEIEEIVSKNSLHNILIPTDEMLNMYPSVVCSITADKLLDNGNMFPTDMVDIIHNGIVRVYNSEKKFIGLYSRSDNNKYYKPYKIFPS